MRIYSNSVIQIQLNETNDLVYRLRIVQMVEKKYFYPGEFLYSKSIGTYR